MKEGLRDRNHEVGAVAADDRAVLWTPRLLSKAGQDVFSYADVREGAL